MKDKFTETYKKIITECNEHVVSEGFFRNLKQVFKSNDSNQKEFIDTRKKLFDNNEFKTTDNREWVGQDSNGDTIKVKFAKLNDNNGKFRYELPARVSCGAGDQKIKVMTSDTMDELAKKINKVLHGLGVDFNFTSEGNVDKAAKDKKKAEDVDKANKDEDDDIDS